MAYQLDKSSRTTKSDGGRQGPLARRESMLSPFGTLEGLHRELDRAFEDLLGGDILAAGIPRGFALPQAFSPRIDVQESDKEIAVSAELPGVDQKDLNVEVTDGALSITGEKRQEKEEEREGWQVCERSYGSFRRIIPLPSEVNAEAIKASFKDGVLKVTIPKKPEAQEKRKRIQIQTEK